MESLQGEFQLNGEGTGVDSGLAAANHSTAGDGSARTA